MKRTSSSPMAGGFAIAILSIVGAVGGGVFFGQPSIGFLYGVGLGVLIALTIWLTDRRRR